MQKITMNFQQFNATMYQMAQQQIEGSPPQQIQQLNHVLLQTFQMFTQGNRLQDHQQILGKTFPNMPPAGYVPEPGPAAQFPENPVTSPGTSPQPGDGKSGLIQTGRTPPKFVTPGGYTHSSAW